MAQPADAKIRVLHVITRLIVGGAQENTLYSAALLDRQRFEVEVLSGPQTGSEGSLIEETRARGVKLTILPELLRQVSPLNDLKALWKMRQIMRRGRYTIVHTHSSKAGISGRLAARLAGVPLIIHTVHGWSFHEHMHPLLRQVYIWLERWMARYSQALIAVAQKDIEKGLAAGIGRREQYHLVRSAIPLEAFDPSAYNHASIRAELDLPPEAVVVGNIGRFSAQKNPLDWAHAAGSIARACPEAFFVMVGDGPLRGAVEQALAQEGIRQRVRLTGLRRDVGRMLAATDVFLMTSLWEGLPRALVQAMAMGLPVVAYAADGIAEAVSEGVNGYLAAPGDFEGAAQRCIQLVRHPEIRAQFGRQGMDYARQNFDLRRMIAQIESLYAELLAGPVAANEV